MMIAMMKNFITCDETGENLMKSNQMMNVMMMWNFIVVMMHFSPGLQHHPETNPYAGCFEGRLNYWYKIVFTLDSL